MKKVFFGQKLLNLSRLMWKDSLNVVLIRSNVLEGDKMKS